MRAAAVFFDFQDTLARFRDGVWNSAYGLYVEAAREHGIDLDPETIVLPSDEAWADYQTPEGPVHPSADEATFAEVRIAVHRRRLAQAGITGALAESIGRRIDELEAEPGRYELFDDVLPALERITGAGIRVIIVSNHVWRLAEIVEALGFSPYVDAVVNSARVGYRKPHPAIYRHALEVADVQPGDAVMIGDSLAHDVRAAERLGIRGVLLARDGAPSPLPGIHVISTLHEVPLEWT